MQKADLHDSLSTAHYFATKPWALSPKAEAILLAQRGQAEAAANNVDIHVAVPFRFPKALYGLAALLFISTGLVSLRYFYGHELNLNAPITEIIFQDLAATKSPKSAKTGKNPAKQPDYDEARSLLAKLGLGANLDEKQDEQLDEALADALKSAEKTPGTGDDAKPGQKTESDPLDAPKDANKNEGATPGADGKKSSSPQGDSPGQTGPSSGEKGDKSLLSKLKDAMDNMMGAPGPQGDKKSAAGKQQQSKPSSQAQAGQQPGEPGDEENKTAADGEANGNAQKSNSPGQTSGNSPDKQEGSSRTAGSEDGEKAIKAAAQMKAMGKISELIGKRSEQVTGESMIDVQSGNQKLPQTAYKVGCKAATHGEGIGEVSRDEIPLSVQAYVQEYFQQVRKPAKNAK